MRERAFTTLGPLLLAAASLLGCGRAPNPLSPPHRVFLITVDTLRADHLGVYGYARQTSPNLDRLARDGMLFERAIAQWPRTTPSFASIFTGRYPQTTGMTHRAARRLSAEFVTLPEMMQQAGYTTIAVVSNPVLSAELGWSQGFDEYLETWQTGRPSTEDPLEFRTRIHAPRVNHLAGPLLERYAGFARLFVWLHYSDPHVPYVLPEGVSNPFLRDNHDVSDLLVEEDLTGPRALGENRRLGHYIAQYDANILVADDHIGRILERAGELDLLEDAVIVFTSDHGEGLGEHAYYFRHGAVPYNTNSHVPLFVSYPARFDVGRRVGRPVELIDLYPTLQELVSGESGRGDLEGESLLPFFGAGDPDADGATKRFRYAFSEAGQKRNLRSYYRSVQDAKWKLVFHPSVAHKGRELPVLLELYDLENDPLEEADLAGAHQEQFDRLWQELSLWMKVDGGDSALLDEPALHSEETIKALRALGYLN